MAPFLDDSKANGPSIDTNDTRIYPGADAHVDSNGIFPVADSITPFWRTDLHPLDTHRSTPDMPSETDLLIIGAGYAGAATAYHYYTSNPSPGSVLILEARQACSGATARNGGHIRADIYFGTPKFAEMYGTEDAVKLAQFEVEHVWAVKDVVEKEKIECDFVLTRYCDVSLDEEFAEQTQKVFERTVKEHKDLVDLREIMFHGAKDAERVSRGSLFDTV